MIAFDKIKIDGCYNYNRPDASAPLIWARAKSVEISFDKLCYNPLNNRYVCELDPPFAINENTSYYATFQSSGNWDFELNVSHPPVANLRSVFLDKLSVTVTSIIHDQFLFSHIDCSRNFAIANIGLTID